VRSTTARTDYFGFERALATSLVGQRMIVLCTYSRHACRAMDLMDVAKAHQLSIVRRKGEWEFVETPDLKQAKQEIEKLCGALHILSKPFPGHGTVDAARASGAVSLKQGGRSLARRQPTHSRVSPRQHLAEARCKKHGRPRAQGARGECT
jgi:hypothetical protein